MSHVQSPVGSCGFRDTGLFLARFLRRPFVTGAVAPSSRHLAAAMLRGLDLGRARSVVEYGPGTGAFTAALLPRLHPDADYFAIDIDPVMAGRWRARFPGRTLHVGSVDRVESLCPPGAVGGVDAIVSGLPWASFPDPLQRAALEATARVLRPGGVFVTFGYNVGTWLAAGRQFYRRLPEYFTHVARGPLVWRNIPPAFVVRCVR